MVKMKALIMANVGSDHFCKHDLVPSCLLPLYNDMTVVERQISLLNINGFADEDICVLCGTDGVWATDSVNRKMEGLGVRILRSSKDRCLSRQLFDDDFFTDVDLIIIEGNRVFDIAIISRLKRFNQRDVMVVNGIQDPDNLKQFITVKGDDIVAVKDSDVITFPWLAFAGVMRLSSDAIRLMRGSMSCPRPLLDILGDILGNLRLKAIKYDDLVYGTLNGEHSQELTGGSYSKINFRLVVKKESDNEGRDKLINEIKWLLSMPKELKPYFSEVLEYDIESPRVFYNVPYYGSRNLREHIFDGHLDAKGACDFMENLLDWMFKNVYSRKISDANENWVTEKHIRRVLDRLPECEDKCEELGRIIEADRVVINGVEYRNVRELYTKLSEMKNLLNVLNPRNLVMIHGDLHFQNILLSNETDTGFILVDPRGESLGSDIYYDLGKLWHSFHAKYDFIHSDQFKYNVEWKNGIPNASYSITNMFVERVYDEIYEEFPKRITKYGPIRNDPNWEMKILFSEASHLCSVSTFHINKTETPERSIVMYLIGVKLINEFFDRFIDGKGSK